MAYGALGADRSFRNRPANFKFIFSGKVVQKNFRWFGGEGVLGGAGVSGEAFVE